VSVYRGSAESVSRYLHKGSRVAVDGRLEWREWETADQQKRQAVSVVADTVQFLDSPGDRSDTEDRELAGVGTESGDADLVF
jgi:single-strand DNA-binding protein